ncbi:putative cation transporter protein [Phaeoacremonium minimum UCRPA7]|uniref:Putative cation transporter protein n=1 Tax=Phaeoacremonium minimum (strain UCR-PA7) TaxID=1286976 RepID=R8BSY0_PHAM7|nr:putative cation transporter protein [Phaeoacremonium minimum UCRPA7]EOO02380.1 putative cation transporter protein [Phaeoacremonium minimum UCRPA7]
MSRWRPRWWNGFVGEHPWVASCLSRARSALPPVNFITIHYAYFIVVCLAASVVFWGSSNPSRSITYVDSLFVVVSAMTEAGLNTVNLSQMTTWQQIMLCLLIMLGSSIWVSIWTVAARLHVFEQRFAAIVKAEREKNKRPIPLLQRFSTFRKSVTTPAGDSKLPGTGTRMPQTIASDNFLTGRAAGRNGQFHDLTTEEREHLGGCEYRALKVLAVIVPLYFFLWQLLGCVGLGAWMAYNQPNTARENGINPWWLGIFNGVSAFNNSGMSLLDANMIPFQKAYYVLITMGLMILAGNTAYPLFLRLIFWSMLKVLDRTTAEETLGDFKETIKFILKYPRRVYTNLFPSRQTWWLCFMVVLLNSIDWVAFELLNLGNPVIEAIPTGSRVLDGLFQALGTT